jgi:succinate dehydrogenase / fumarate reductase cytochrome b subunit
MAERPLSPHISVYRWAYTMTLSILHRATGLALSLALIGLTLWLIAIALGPAQYAAWIPWLASWPAMLLYALAIVALVFHFCNGLRHLAWDLGFGYERREARASGWTVIVATVLGSALCLYFLIRHGATP